MGGKHRDNKVAETIRATTPVAKPKRITIDAQQNLLKGKQVSPTLEGKATRKS